MIWSKLKLGDLCLKITDGSHNPPKGIEQNEYLMLSSKNVFDDEITLDNPRYLSKDDFEKENKRTDVCVDDVLLTIVGTVGRAAVVPDGLPKFTLQRSVAVFKPNVKLVTSRFLMFSLQNILDTLMAGARGVAQKGIYLKTLREIEIAIPPVEEQKRIAAILDKTDAIRRKRQQAIGLTDQLLLSVFLDMFGDPVTNPKGWDVKSFSSLGTWSSGGTPSRKNKEYFTGVIDWYSAGELNTRYVNTSIEKITKTAIKESAAKLFKSGSILLGMYDTAAFKSSILKTDSASNQACTNLEPNDSISVEWFYTYIQIAKEHYLRLRRGVRQKNLNLGMIKEFELPLPPIDRQKKFEKICGSILKLGVTDHDSYELTESLFNSLTQQAFNGELSKQTKAA